MEAENDDRPTEGSSSEPQGAEDSRPVSKLRDLIPEKDPMGAGGKTNTSPPPDAAD